MPLSFLHHRYVEICSQMAATAKNAEIREQWTKLAEQWRQKAEADENQDPLPVATLQAPTLVPEATTPLQQNSVATLRAPILVPEAATLLQQRPVAAPQAPTLVPETTTPLQQKPVAAPQAPTLVPETTTPPQQKPLAETSNTGRLDDIWANIASHINLED